MISVIQSRPSFMTHSLITGTRTRPESIPPIRTWDELHEPLGDKTPPPSPKTPVFSVQRWSG